MHPVFEEEIKKIVMLRLCDPVQVFIWLCCHSVYIKCYYDDVVLLSYFTFNSLFFHLSANVPSIFGVLHFLWRLPPGECRVQWKVTRFYSLS